MELKNKKILVFTGGGLSPSLNPTLYGVINEAKKRKAKIYGGFFGWRCLLNGGKIMPLNNFKEEKIKNEGGTFLRSSRTNPYKFKNGPQEIKNNFEKHSFDYMIPIGGNDTLGAAYRFFKEKGIKLVAVPKTIDNDLSETYWAPGFPTAAAKLINITKEIRGAAYALSRIFIIEIFGEKAGWLTASAYLGKADIIVPPERYIDIDRVIKLIKEKYKKNKGFVIIAMSKEARLGDKIKGVVDDQNDSYGIVRQELKSHFLKKEIKKRLNIDTKIIIPGNYLQTGPAIKIDRDFSILLGRTAVKMLDEGLFGFMPSLAKSGNKIVVKKIELSKNIGSNYLNNEMFDFKKLVPKKAFLNYMKPIMK